MLGESLEQHCETEFNKIRASAFPRAYFEKDNDTTEGTKGDYIAHIIKANGKELKDEVKEWHIHECDFQFVLVLNGWATFEYEGEGIKTIRKGDAINQTPRIVHREIDCSPDFEVLEIVAPADFKTKIVDNPK